MLRCVICTKGSSVTIGWVPICCGVARRVSDVGEPSQERVHGNVTVVDGCAFVLGERDVGEDPPQVALGFEQLGLGGLEIATGAGHSVLVLLEEAVAAPAVAEVVVLPGLAVAGATGR